MFTLPHFCRICLKYDKNLIDLAHIENEPNETLMSKLQFCASEVEWSTYKPLLCHPCIKRLNIAYSFKKECIQSANVLKSYLELLKDSQAKGQVHVGEAGQQGGGAYMVLPNQKYLKILVGAQNNQNTFQNVFLNVIPTPTNPPVLVPTDSPKNKDTNQNIFLNINNIFKKYVPIAPNENAKLNADKNSVNVNQLLTDTKTEELSVEIDPTDFGLVDEGESSTEEGENDWDELITHTKINSDVTISKVNGNKRKSIQRANTDDKNYVPIQPKHGASDNVSDEKMEYFAAGHHFLSSNVDSRDYACESCQKAFGTLTDLKTHLKHFHMGKLPYKCDHCYIEFAVKADYEMCMKFHKEQQDQLNSSLTLQDFANGANVSQSEQLQSLLHGPLPQSDENGEFNCDVCHRIFTSSTGLLRHKVRKHNQKNKKKYFIKGMKNAKCDICNREFSTQSYMQLHRKLHMRDVTGYKYKVFGKNKYVNDNNIMIKSDTGGNVKIETDDVNVESVDCTPDIVLEKIEYESDDEDEVKMEIVEDELDEGEEVNIKTECSRSEDGELELQNDKDVTAETAEKGGTEDEDEEDIGESEPKCVKTGVDSKDEVKTEGKITTEKEI